MVLITAMELNEVDWLQLNVSVEWILQKDTSGCEEFLSEVGRRVKVWAGLPEAVRKDIRHV